MFALSLEGDTKTRGAEEGKRLKETLEKLIWNGGPIKEIVSENRIDPARLKSAIQANLPDESEWIEAISDGAFFDSKELFKIFTMELGPNFRLTPPAIAFALCLPSDDGDKELPYIGVNLDSPIFLHPLLILREVRPPSGPSWIEVSFITSAGAFFGINELGLSLALSLKPFERDGAGYLPLSLAIREALKRCKDVNGALRLISELPRGASGIISIADVKNCAAVEVTPKRCEIRETKKGEFFASAQHFLGSEMMARDIEHDEVYTDFFSPELSGKRIYSESERRVEAACDLFRNKKNCGAHTLIKNLQSEKDGLYLSRGYYKTAVSAVLTPKEKGIYLKGPKGEDEYKL